MSEPLSFEEEQARLQRRQAAGEQMLRDQAVWMGDCYQCWLPLSYPPVKIPRLDTVQWSAETIEAVTVDYDPYCVECVVKVLEKYVQKVRLGPVEIKGTRLSTKPS